MSTSGPQTHAQKLTHTHARKHNHTERKGKGGESKRENKRYHVHAIAPRIEEERAEAVFGQVTAGNS